MQRIALLLTALAGLAAAARPPAAAAAAPARAARPRAGPALPPAWGGQYEVEYELEMPYFQQLQPGGFRYKAHIWVDEAAGSTRVDYNGGEQQSLFVGEKEYSTAPRKFEKAVCRVFDNPGKGPVRGRPSTSAGPLTSDAPLGAPALPDLSKGGWVDGGASEVGGVKADLWQKREIKGQAVSSYALYVAADGGAPLRMHAVGVDIVEGSHYDEYSYTFLSFRRGAIDPKVFAIPSICNDSSSAAFSNGDDARGAAAAGLPPAGAAASAAAAVERQSALAALAAALEGALGGARWYAARMLGRAAAAPGDGAPAAGALQDLERPHTASRAWTQRHGRLVSAKARRAPVATFKSRLTSEQLPKFFDWRGTPADVAVKDQAQCGSCWAFSATGSLEGAWFTATGQSRSFSEQQLIDCAWDEGGHGCDGGDVRSAFDYVTAAGGIATTAAYPYRGQPGLCRHNTTAKEGFFDGFVRVDQDDASVMEALMRHGPLAIGIDADYDFGAYSEGIYYEKRCSTRPSRLNHAVILVGWGEREGEKYFIVRNTWSSLWGQNGYILMHRGGNDCGIASDAVFAKVAKKYVVPGAQAAATELGLARGRELQKQEEGRADAKRAAAAAAAVAAVLR
ncbi:MAG: cysteine endopeptidase [Monoraphidium minutum]|nr:MAG: cysteine endopeptidase [Monoraphidium minutum]